MPTPNGSKLSMSSALLREMAKIHHIATHNGDEEMLVAVCTEAHKVLTEMGIGFTNPNLILASYWPSDRRDQ